MYIHLEVMQKSIRQVEMSHDHCGLIATVLLVLSVESHFPCVNRITLLPQYQSLKPLDWSYCTQWYL